MLQPTIRLQTAPCSSSQLDFLKHLGKLLKIVTTNHAKPRGYEKETCIKKAEDWRPNGIAATKVLLVHRLLRRTTKGISIFTVNLLIRIAVVCGGTRTQTKLKRNLSVHKRFPAQPVFLTQVFFSYRLITLIKEVWNEDSSMKMLL